MQPDDYTHWLELVGAALAGLGAWIWRVAAKLASYDEQLQTLKAALAAEQIKRSTRDAEMFAKLEDLRVHQAVQGADIKHISTTCSETNQAILEILADRLPGGGRKNDPPRRDS